MGKDIKRTDVVFDRYYSQSIKVGMRTNRKPDAQPIRCVFKNREVPLPQNWKNFLSPDNNKVRLNRFLSDGLAISDVPCNWALITGEEDKALRSKVNIEKWHS